MVSSPTIAFEKIVYAFLLLFNIYAVLVLFDYHNVTETILIVDTILFCVLKAEKVIKLEQKRLTLNNKRHMRFLEAGMNIEAPKEPEKTKDQ